MEISLGRTHSSEICTEHRDTLQCYNMFYNIIILHIFRHLLSIGFFSGESLIPLDFLFKYCCSHYDKICQRGVERRGRRGEGCVWGRRRCDIDFSGSFCRATVLSIRYTLLYTCISISHLYDCIRDTVYVSRSILVS